MDKENFVKKRRYLFWDIKNPENVSEESLVEHVINYGDWDDVESLFALLGREKVAKIFTSQTHRDRVNYDKKVVNYFKLYFAKHA